MYPSKPESKPPSGVLLSSIYDLSVCEKEDGIEDNTEIRHLVFHQLLAQINNLWGLNLLKSELLFVNTFIN